MKKILFSVGVDRLKSKFRQLSSPRFREYALFYNFEYHEITEYPPLDRKPHWIKIHYIIKLIDILNDGDLIAFLDADIAILRGDIELTTSKSIGLVKNGVFNTGVIAVRVNDFSRKFFEAVWNRTDCFKHDWQENMAIIKLLDNLSEAEMEQHIEILPNSLNVVLAPGEYTLFHEHIGDFCEEPIRFRHFAGGQPWYKQYFALPIAWDGVVEESNLPLSLQLPIRFITTVINGEPFIRYHIEVFKQLPFNWHWHIIEGVSGLESNGELSSNIKELYKNGLSNDGTSEYLDELALAYPENVTIYREPKNSFWKSKFEMMWLAMNSIIREELLECLMWRIEVNELWTVDRICTAWQMFLENPQKTAAFYKSWTFVGNNLVISNKNIKGGDYHLQGLRTWIFKPVYGYGLVDENSPIVFLPSAKGEEVIHIDVAAINPFTREETEKEGLIFQDFAYATPEQLEFKEQYCGYQNTLSQWQTLQSQTRFPVYLRDFFGWVDDNTTVDTARSLGVEPLAQQDLNTGSWKFLHPEYLPTKTANRGKRSPTIIIDGVLFQFYSAGVVRLWRSLFEVWAKSEFAAHIIVLDRGNTVPKIPGINYRIVPACDRNHPDVDRQMLQQVCDEEEADLFISTYYTTPISTPSVFLAYDIISEKFAADLDRLIWPEKDNSICDASSYLLISENPDCDLAKFFPGAEANQVTVISLDPNDLDGKKDKMARTMSSALIKATLGRLNLQEINLIIFPDWLQPEETVGLELQEVIKSMATHPDRTKMILLIDNSNISAEETDLILSSVAMNMLMEEDLDVNEGPEIVLVEQLSQIQWSFLIPQLQGLIKLKHENRVAIAKVNLEYLAIYYEPKNLLTTEFSSKKNLK